MSIEIKVPELPESVSDATVSEWHKKPGDAVKRDEKLVDLETDKIMLDVPAPEDGVLEEILRDEGSVVEADQVIAKIDTEKQASKEQDKPSDKQEKESAKDKEKEKEKDKKADAEEKTEAEGEKDVGEPSQESEEPPMSPSARRLAKEHQLDPADIEASGKQGRILKEDVEKVIENTKSKQKEQKSAKSDKEATREEKSGTESERPEQRVPMSRMRARIAERLLEVKQNTAMLTTFNEVNMKPVMDLRAQYKETFQKQHDVKLGFMSFFVKAAVEALKRFPAVNASIDGTDIIYHGYFDIGIAVSTDKGLVVPVLRDADQMSMADIEKQIIDYGQRANEGKLALEEMQGGTFSITNGGIFGSMLSTPILNPPQSAILGMHSIDNRPVVENGEIVARPMMYLALSYDHRLIDGREAVTFLVTIKQLLEEPSRMLLNI